MEIPATAALTTVEIEALVQLCDRIPLIGPESKAIIASAQAKLIAMHALAPPSPFAPTLRPVSPPR